MYRSYGMVQRNLNFLGIFRKLTIDLISRLPISSYAEGRLGLQQIINNETHTRILQWNVYVP